MNTDLERYDDLDNKFDWPIRLNKILSILFYISASTSCYLIYDPSTELSVIFFIATIFYLIISVILSVYLIPDTFKARRKTLFSDSFCVQLSSDKTINYYTNSEIEDSCKKLLFNSMENCFNSREVLKIMKRRTNRILILYFLLWFILLFFYKSNEWGIILWITQLSFSSEVFCKAFTIDKLSSRCTNIFESMFLLATKLGKMPKKESLPEILSLITDYECALSSSKVLISSDIFFEEKSRLEKDWLNIKSELISI